MSDARFQDGYQSPLVRRLTEEAPKFTAATLAELVPVFQAGHHARERLRDEKGSLTPSEVDELTLAASRGETVMEQLVLMGLPQVRMLAQKEYDRRSQWRSTVTLADLQQEGIVGLLKGLVAYQMSASGSSAKNYLSTWIVVQMRRGTALFDHDFTVSTETSDRHRRIRAIRARLTDELGREPSPEEISDASADPSFKGSALWGRKESRNKARRITPEQVIEERVDSIRVGYGERIGVDQPHLSPGAAARQEAEYAPLDGEPADTTSAESAALYAGHKEGLQSLIADAIDRMGLPAVQRDMVSRTHGLAPYAEEQSARAIGDALGFPRADVAAVVEAFATEMTRPGGAFHYACARWSEDDLAAIGLGWVRAALGSWDDVAAIERMRPPPLVLTEPMTPLARRKPPPPEGQTTATGVIAQYVCERERAAYTVIYQEGKTPQDWRPCTRCGQPSKLIRYGQTGR